jgi:putative RNA 2'-phosphotransferase
MTDPLFVCTDHGVYAGRADAGTAACPDCGVVGERLLDGDRRRRLSTFLAGALRHFPGDAGLTLDAAGFTPWTELVAAVDRQYDWADERDVEAVVAADPKGRFETRERDDGGDTHVEVRAAYGHSVEVDLDADDRDTSTRDDTGAHDVPGTLYHGTSPRNVAAIREDGLKPMGRQAVHLSGSRESARSVGARHTDREPVVIVVDVRELAATGRTVRKRGVDTYTVDRVPPACLTVPTNV